MTFQDSKPKTASVTLWGAAIAVAAPVIGGLVGQTITEADTTQVVNAISMVVSGIGGLVAFFGRLRANKSVR